LLRIKLQVALEGVSLWVFWDPVTSFLISDEAASVEEEESRMTQFPFGLFC
jgi:hypothetical protein